MAAVASSHHAKGDPAFTHAVSRSSELLSCAKTALKVGKMQNRDLDDHGGTTWWACQEPNLLALCSWKDQMVTSHLDGLCEDALALLRTMKVELAQLEALVRRRGHTNDPTEEISASVRRLEADAEELSSLVKTGFVFPRASAQYRRHAQLIATWLESMATQQMAQLKEILKVRGHVLADQAQRRKLLNPQGIGANANGAKEHVPLATTSPPKKLVPKALDTPLFNRMPLQKPGHTNGNFQNGRAAATANPPIPGASTPAYGRIGSPSTASGGYGGYVGGYGGTGGYYGGGNAPGTSGIRQRRAKVSGMLQQNNEQNEAAQIQMQIQQRQQQRQTESRLQEAHQAERSLAELSSMFTKFTTLVAEQGEVLEKVEDDVEAGLGDVILGEQEIVDLYTLKKGNRGLIIKLFSLLIFLIIFMRFYKK